MADINVNIIGTGPVGPQGPEGRQGNTGPTGPQGPAGSDGVSPEVTISTITGGHRMTITDAEHPTGQSFDVMDGAQGPRGEDATVDPTLTIAGDAADAKVAGDAINELDTIIDPMVSYYPTFVRGSGNNNTGLIVPNESVLNRICEVEYIPTQIYDSMHVENGILATLLYYDSNKAFVSAGSTWLTAGTAALDTTKPYVRLFCKNADNSNFDTVPNPACYFFNSTKQIMTQKQEYDENTGIFGLAYSHKTVSTNAANTVRWFIRQTFNKGYLKEIKIYDAISAWENKVIVIELWELQNGLITRTKELTYQIRAGDNVLAINESINDGTYISFAVNTTGALKLESGVSGDCYILRDKVSTSFNPTAFEAQAFFPAVDVLLYALPQNDSTQHVYTIGQNDNVAAIISEAMYYNGSIVYIEPYEHDCISEWEAYFGANYFANMSSGRGIELQNDIHIIGRSGHKLKCYYTGDNDYVMENFSLFNNPAGGSGYTLENVCIDTKKIRYCIHDERGADTVPYKVRYSRCVMSQDMTGSTWDHSRACIGGGLGQHADIVVEDCIFSTVTSSANMDSLAYHNSAGSEAQNSLVIKNCYCTGDSTLQLASYGTSTKKTKAIVANCSFGSPIEILDWTSGTPNFEIYQINNEVRT